MSDCVKIPQNPCVPKSEISKIRYLDETDCLVAGSREDITTCDPTTHAIVYRDSEGNILPTPPKEIAVSYVVTSSCVTPLPPPVNAPATACLADTTVLAVDTLSQAVHTAPGTALQVKLCDPVVNLKLEFSETKLYSASTELGLFRIREYNEDSGLWTLRYENSDGTPFTDPLPADMTATSAQVVVSRTTNLGCAAGVPYLKRETSKFDAETGEVEAEIVDWIDSAGVITTTAPAGFSLGPCPDVCEVVAPVGVINTWG